MYIYIYTFLSVYFLIATIARERERGGERHLYSCSLKIATGEAVGNRSPLQVSPPKAQELLSSRQRTAGFTSSTSAGRGPRAQNRVGGMNHPWVETGPERESVLQAIGSSLKHNSSTESEGVHPRTCRHFGPTSPTGGHFGTSSLKSDHPVSLSR